MTTVPTLAGDVLVAWILDTLRPRLLASLKGQRLEGEALADWQARNRSQMRPDERSLQSVLNRVSNLLGVFDRLDRARYLIGRSPQPTRTTALRLNRGDWTEYHFLMFTATLVSVVDCSVLLVAESYQLGIPERQCKMEIVVDNSWVKGSRSATALRSLAKTLTEHSGRRNRYLHRGESADIGEITDPEFMTNLRMITWLASNGKLDVDPQKLNAMWRITLSEARPLLDSGIDGARLGVIELLSALDEPVRQRFARVGA